MKNVGSNKLKIYKLKIEILYEKNNDAYYLLLGICVQY